MLIGVGDLYILINGTEDTNLRECFGFYDRERKKDLAETTIVTELREFVLNNKSLLLWPEEVSYLHDKGLISFNASVDPAIGCFYARERDEGRFLIRTAVQQTYEELESQQELKR
jgi:hypothetical protein